ncbi:MAG: carbohydrate-binding domain-containing protein [Oscillospiraceae bacterium]|nr:carbohydrate-binding domain-containing protein [Oscillospiraceae bacterium]
MSKNLKGFFASAMLFSVLASGCSDNNVNSSDISKNNIQINSTSITDDNSSDNDNEDEENDNDKNKTNKNQSDIIPLALNIDEYNADLNNIFSENDLNPSYNAENEIILKDNSAEVNGKGILKDSSILITEGGKYKISGNFNGQIKVNSDEKIWLILDNANINCSDSAPIYIEKADKVFITLAPDSENTLTDGISYKYDSEEQNEPDAVIFSKDNLTLNGTGILNINANYNEGITSKDDITITGGKININSVGNGIKGKDCIAITSTEINITAEADGMKSSNTKDEGKGFVFINDGIINIDAKEDAIQSEQELIINGGNININSGNGSNSENVKEHTDSMMDFGRFRQQNNKISEIDESTEDNISMKGIKAGGNIYINNGNIKADCADDAVHSDNEVNISGGNLEISSGSKGIHSDNKLSISNGTINILKSYEGLESTVINISGGDISIVSDDDGMNASNGTSNQPFQASDGTLINISGGNIYVNAEGDGLDSNGMINITNGTINIDGPSRGGNGALDSDGKISVDGGMIIAVGSPDMAEYPDSESKQKFLTMNASLNEDSIIKLCSSDGKEIISYQPKKNYSSNISIIISSSKLSEDEEYTLYIDENEAGSYKTTDIPASGFGKFNKDMHEEFENGRKSFDFDEDFNGEMPDDFPKDFNGEMPDDFPKHFNKEMPKDFSNDFEGNFDKRQTPPDDKMPEFNFEQPENNPA